MRFCTILTLSALTLAQGHGARQDNTTTLQVVHHAIRRSPASILQAKHLKRRQNNTTTVASLENRGFLYEIDIALGSPPQNMKVQLDTGSSDLWVNTANGEYSICNSDLWNPCPSGVYDANFSRTYEYVNSDFNISYADGSRVLGDYAADTLMFGDVPLHDYQFGIGYHSFTETAIMGIGYPANEAIAQRGGEPYPNIAETLATTGRIQTPAYSLWLNDLDATSGSLLFGGIDTSKWSNSLVTIPMSSDPSRFIISLSGIGTNHDATSIARNVDIPALLDSGSSLTYLPNHITRQIYDLVGATYDSDVSTTSSSAHGLALIDCNASTSDTTLSFRFAKNLVLKVPISSFVLRENVVFPKCVFGISPGEDSLGYVSVLGDTILRAAYVVYDMRNNEISVAQAKVGDTGAGNVVEIGEMGVLGIDGVDSKKAVLVSGAKRTGGLGRPFIVGLAFLVALNV